MVRERAVELLGERYPKLDAPAVYARMNTLGEQQLAATITHLDVHVPTVRIVVDHDATPSLVAIDE